MAPTLNGDLFLEDWKPLDLDGIKFRMAPVSKVHFSVVITYDRMKRHEDKIWCNFDENY